MEITIHEIIAKEINAIYKKAIGDQNSLMAIL